MSALDQTSSPSSSTVDVVPEAVEVWRTWALGMDTRVGTPLLLPTVGARRAWQPRVRKQARCSRGRVHAAPFARCSCGIYGAKDRRLLWRTRDPAVLGTVALWGTIIEQEYAYRGRFAYPQRLGLICPFCFWQQRRDSPVEHVARIPRHRLVPMCDRHFATARDTGYPIRGVLAPSEVIAALLDAYAVDPIDRTIAAQLTGPPDNAPRAGTAGTPRR